MPASSIISPASYTAIGDDQTRHDALTDALADAARLTDQIRRAVGRLYAAEAGIHLRREFPNAERVDFDVTHDDDDVDGKTSVDITGVYNAAGDKLWHDDDYYDGYYVEWDDDSLVRDRLAALAEWNTDYGTGGTLHISTLLDG